MILDISVNAIAPRKFNIVNNFGFSERIMVNIYPGILFVFF